MISARAAYTLFLVSVITTGADCEYLYIHTIPMYILFKDVLYTITLESCYTIITVNNLKVEISNCLHMIMMVSKYNS